MLTCYFLALSFVALISAAGLSPANHNKGLKLDFRVLHGDSIENASALGKSGLGKRSKKNPYFSQLSLKNVKAYYQADVFIGSNKDKCTVLVDTGSSDLWVIDSNTVCDIDVKGKYHHQESTFKGNSICTVLGSFDSSKSKTFQKNTTAPEFYLSFDDNTYTRGHWGFDKVGFSNSEIMLSFGVAKQTSSMEGILGIGLMAGESTVKERGYSYNNFPVQLKNEGIIKKQMYSIFLNKPEADSGSILFGAVDHQKYEGSLKTVPIVNIHQHYIFRDVMAITLDGISLESDIQNVTILDEPIGASLSSGTTLQKMPRNVLNALVLSLQGNFSKEEGLYQVDCAFSEKSGYMVYDFSGIKIRVPLSEMIYENNDRCYLGVEATDNKAEFAHAILGDSFLRYSYVVINLEDHEVSMAQARYSIKEDVQMVKKTIPRATRAKRYGPRPLVPDTRLIKPKKFKAGQCKSDHTKSSAKPKSLWRRLFDYVFRINN